jgi:hypothetical protein
MIGFLLTLLARMRAEVNERGRNTCPEWRGAFPLLGKCRKAGQYFSHQNRQYVHTLQEREVEASEGFARLFVEAVQTRDFLP